MDGAGLRDGENGDGGGRIGAARDFGVGVGDHVGNLITPFWYVVIAGIARVNFRSFFGYGVVFGLIWFVIGVIVFTFAPC